MWTVPSLACLSLAHSAARTGQEALGQGSTSKPRAYRSPGDTPHRSCPPQGYQWLKDKILSEEGRRQQAKLKELQAISERLGCSLPQLAIGNAGQGARPCPGNVGRSPSVATGNEAESLPGFPGQHRQEATGGS